MAYVTREDVRKVVTTKLETLRASFTDYQLVIEYDNLETVNQATQSDPYVVVTFRYLDGYQINLGPSSETRALGTIVLEVFDKYGAGTARQNKVLDHFYRSLHKTDSMQPVRTLAARFASKPVQAGWAAQAALIPFWYDTE